MPTTRPNSIVRLANRTAPNHARVPICPTGSTWARVRVLPAFGAFTSPGTQRTNGNIMRIALIALVLLSGCSGAQVKQRGDGTYSLDCSEKKACLDRADRLCAPGGYVIVGGKSNKKRYGVPGNEKLVGKEEIYVRCSKDRPTDTPDEAAGSWRLKHSDDVQPSASAPATQPPAAQPPAALPPAATPSVTKAVCRPGETERCVGPGACEGGQACLADGSAFGPCDCGTATTKAAH